jgi:monoamine oxidase
VLAKIDTDLSAEVKQAVASVRYDYANKVGFEAPRFWERQQIYGGLSFVGGETRLVWYPSDGLHSARGMLLGCYASGEPAKAFAARAVQEQVEISRRAVETLHPGHGRDLEKPVVVNWSKIPFSYGAWPNYSGRGVLEEGHIDHPAHRLLNEPQGRVYLSGAQLSQMPGWQEGAVCAAHRTLGLLADRVGQSRTVETLSKAGRA